MLYLYAIADGLESVEGITGVANEPLALLPLGDLPIVAGEVESQPAIDGHSLARQDDIIRQLHTRADALLPMRFGSGFASQQDAERAIKLRGPTLVERLTLVRGKDQMTLRVLRAAGASDLPALPSGGTGPPHQPASDATAGAEYLRARAALARPHEIVPLLDALAPLQRGSRIERGRTVGFIATVYQLIDRGTSEKYRITVDAAGATLPHLSIRVSGPSPCYAFT